MERSRSTLEAHKSALELALNMLTLYPLLRIREWLFGPPLNISHGVCGPFHSPTTTFSSGMRPMLESIRYTHMHRNDLH